MTTLTIYCVWVSGKGLVCSVGPQTNANGWIEDLEVSDE